MPTPFASRAESTMRVAGGVATVLAALCVAPPALAQGAPPSAGQAGTERGALWTGTVRWTAKQTPTHRVTSSASLRLRERHVSDGTIELIHEGSTVTVGHSTVGADDCTYSGQGTSPATGTAGWLLRERNVGPNGELRLGRWNYKLAITPLREPIWTQTCPDVAWPGTDRTHTVTYGGDASGSWLAYLGESIDPVAPRFLDGGRMRGSYTVAPGSSWEDSVSWSVCRQGVTCPAPPADQEPCPEPPEKALLQTALAQQKLLKDQVSAKFDEYSRLAQKAQQYKSDFELAIYTCNRISDLQVLLNLLIGQAPANIKQFNSYLGVVQNILQGNATFVIDDYVSENNALMGAWGKLMFALDRIVPASAPPLRSQLMPCAGSNLDAVFDGAMNFVQLMEQIEPVMRQAHKLLNDQRSKDQEIFNLWSKYRPACLEHAKCMKLSASYCDKLPSIEGWHPAGPPRSASGGGPGAGRPATSSPASSAPSSRTPAGGGFIKP
jgi:hypothetical protein